MQKALDYFLNRPYPLFLKCRQGCIYFIWMIFFVILVANLVEPLGFTYSQEFHKSLLMDCYIVVFYGVYAWLFTLLSYFFPNYYNPHTWNVKKELSVLIIYFPATAFITYLYVCHEIPDFKPCLHAFYQLQYYNLILSIPIPLFAYLVDTRLNPYTLDKNSSRKENNESRPILDEQQARRDLQQLHEVMETKQLYLSNKCSLLLVSEHTDIPGYRISIIINAFTEYSFTDFVNKYRVEHVCRILQNVPDKNLTLEGIGRECGFGGKVNFHHVFKKFTGKTPAQYLANLKNNPK